MSSLNKIIIIFFLLFSYKALSKETWHIDKDISSIEFILPLFLAKNVKGKFNEIEGFVEIDINNNNNN